MKKVFCLVMGILISALFFSCNDLNSAGLLKEEIDNAINDAKTPRVTLKISLNNSFGTLTGETGGIYKLNDVKKLSFEESDAYQFVCWKVYNAEGEEQGSTANDAVYIADVSKKATTFKILKDVSGYCIQPVCELRPSVTFASPQYQTSGVPRDRAIIINFASEIDASNFFYSQDEAQALLKNNSTLLKDSGGNVYGYISKAGVYYYKNIKIRNAENNSDNLISFFSAPEISGSKLTISPKKGAENQFALDSNGYKDIKVTLLNSINNNGISLRNNYQWTYRIGNVTDEQTVITFATDAAFGEMSLSGSSKYSVGAEVSLKFTEKEKYKFIEWQISGNQDETVYAALTSNSYDETKGQCEALFTVLEGSGNLTVRPVCAARPVIEDFSPAYIPSGSAFDSAIQIQFASAVSKESFVFSTEEFESFGETAQAVRIDSDDEQSDIVAVDVGGKRYFKNIMITDSSNQNISIHYKKAVLSSDCKKLTLSFDSSKLFDFGTDSTKDIYVTINPAVHSDYIKSDGTAAPVFINGTKKNLDYNFRIRNSSESKAKIRISAYDENSEPVVEMGSLNYKGEQEFNLGQKVTLNFVPASDYSFIRWVVTGNDKDNILCEEDKSKTSFTFTVLGKADDISIKPYCEKLSLSTILFSTPSGTISPSGYVKLRRKETANLICKVSEKNCFASWTVINTVSNEVLSKEAYEKYFEFGDINSAETTLKVINDSKNLSIVADTYVRPAVYDHDPLNQITGSNRDQSIRIFVTPGIDEKTLYYTDEEANQLEKEGYTLLNAGNNINRKYYGCYIPDDANSYLFKNVKITNRGNASENLLQHYGAPYLQDAEGSVIVIPVKMTNLPPEYKEILVTLGTEYGYYSTDKKTVIGLYDNNLIFSYKTNSNEDKTVPVFKSFSLKGKDYLGNKKIISCRSEEPELPESGTFDYDKYKDYYLKAEEDGTLNVDIDIKLSDEGLNLNSLTMYLKEVRNNRYESVETPHEYSIILPMNVNATEGSVAVSDYKLSDIINKDGSTDGLYKIWFKATDLSSNNVSTEDTEFYYILFDRTAPSNITAENYVKNGCVKVTGITADADSKYTYAQFDDNQKIKVSSASQSLSLSGLEHNQEVEFKVIVEDYFGNKKTYTSQEFEDFKMNAGAQKGMYLYSDGFFSKTPYNKSNINGVVTNLYGDSNNKIDIALKQNLEATPNQITAGNYPDPKLTGVLSGMQYRIPNEAEWSNIASCRNSFELMDEALNKDDYCKYTVYGEKPRYPVNEIYDYKNTAAYFAKLDVGSYGLFEAKYTWEIGLYTTRDTLYPYFWVESAGDSNFLVKYLVSYQDNAQ